MTPNSLFSRLCLPALGLQKRTSRLGFCSFQIPGCFSSYFTWLNPVMKQGIVAGQKKDRHGLPGLVHTAVILPLRRQRQEDHVFKARAGEGFSGWGFTTLQRTAPTHTGSHRSHSFCSLSCHVSQPWMLPTELAGHKITMGKQSSEVEDSFPTQNTHLLGAEQCSLLIMSK